MAWSEHSRDSSPAGFRPGQDVGITVSGVQFSFGSREVLSRIDLKVPQGQMWGLVGRSGTGKSTLLNIMAGLYTPNAGEIFVAGREREQHSRIRGVVFQEDSLIGWLSVRENLLFPKHLHPVGDAIPKSEALLRELGLSDRASALPGQLSAGMRKRVEFARALLSDTDYLLMDEPFGSVDALTRRELWSMWHELRKSAPRTGIMSTHDPEEALRMCDAVVVLSPNSPSTITKILPVSPSIRELQIDQYSDELADSRAKIIEWLGTDSGDTSHA